MKAILLISPTVAEMSDPTTDRVARAANQLYAMGIDVIFYSASELAPLTAAQFDELVSSTGASMIVLPSNTSASRDIILNIFNGQLANNIPLFVLSSNHVALARISGVATMPLDNNPYLCAYVSTGGEIMSWGHRYTLSTETLPAQSVGLVQQVEAPTFYAAWKYTPDGETWVYYEIFNQLEAWLPILIQEAINDGVLAKPPMRAPIILNIDHWNGRGDDDSHGATGEPGIVRTSGDILRAANGVCYASFEQNDYGFNTETLKQNFRDYADVFKYIACHDHSSLDLSNSGYLTADGTTADDARANQETKAAIDGSYQATKTGIEAMGLTVSPEFAHFATNHTCDNFWQMAQKRNNILCDPADTTAQEGYGVIMGRVDGDPDNSRSYPTVNSGNGNPNIRPWTKNKTVHRGITLLASADAGTDNGAEVDLTKDWFAFARNIKALSWGLCHYWHSTDFETGAASDGTAFTRGHLSWQYGADFQAACPDVVNFGANILDYQHLLTDAARA